MKTISYIKQYQPVLYESFKLALQNNRLSHAYLLVGEPGTPLLKTAKFLAKSILCDSHNEFACEECRTCLRIESGNYIDLRIIDGRTNGSIKKDEITSLVSAFSNTALEAKAIQVYIINLVEIMRPEDEAVHALLKFLEEPHENVYAILTTNNEERVIPTILSRCQILSIRLRDRNNVVEEAVKLGVPAKTAEILSKLSNDPDEIKAISSDEKTSKLINQFDVLLGCIKKSRKTAIFHMQKEIIPEIKTKEAARFFLDLLSELFHELINLKNKLKRYLPNYDKILRELLPLFPNPEEGLYLILESRSKIEINVTISLILDHLIICLLKGLQ